MDLFLPESGLMIWMLIAFLIVFAILAKVGWPMIMGGVEKHNAHINESLLAAEEANNALAGIEQKKQETMAAAQAEQIRIMKESQDLKAQVIEEAKVQARQEAEKIVAEARVKIEKEQAEAMVQIKNNLAEFGHSKAFRLSDDGFEWMGDYEITADEVLGGITPKANKLERAKALLIDLAETSNMMQSEEIMEIAKEEDISKRTMETAKKELGIRATKINNAWYWVLKDLS